MEIIEKFKKGFSELKEVFKELNFKEKIIIFIFYLIVTPLVLLAIITDLIIFIYIFILKKIFKQELSYFSFTYLILFWEKI